jgi:hypothetical protein
MLFMRTWIVTALRQWCHRAYNEIVGAVKKPDTASELHYGRSVAWWHLDLLETIA